MKYPEPRLPNPTSEEARHYYFRNDGPRDSVLPTAPCVSIIVYVGSSANHFPHFIDAWYSSMRNPRATDAKTDFPR